MNGHKLFKYRGTEHPKDQNIFSHSPLPPTIPPPQATICLGFSEDPRRRKMKMRKRRNTMIRIRVAAGSLTTRRLPTRRGTTAATTVTMMRHLRTTAIMLTKKTSKTKNSKIIPSMTISTIVEVPMTFQ